MSSTAAKLRYAKKKRLKTVMNMAQGAPRPLARQKGQETKMRSEKRIKSESLRLRKRLSMLMKKKKKKKKNQDKNQNKNKQKAM